jgi:hypothetical protein
MDRKAWESREPTRARKKPSPESRRVSRFTFYVLRFTFHVSRFTHLPRRSIRAEAGSTHYHRRIAPFLHRFFTDFRECISLPPVPQPLAKSDPKNGAIPN